MLECIHCRNSTTQDFIHWENLSTVTIVQHNVPDFIHWKYGESSLFKVYSHCDSVIALVLIQLHSNPLSSTMDNIIMLLLQLHSNPLSLTMDAIIIFQLLHSNPLSWTMDVGKVSVFFVAIVRHKIPDYFSSI